MRQFFKSSSRIIVFINIIVVIAFFQAFIMVKKAEAVVSCPKEGVNVVARKAAGSFISGIKYELYEKGFDANDIPAGDKLVLKGVTDSLGKSIISFRADLKKNYIIKMYDKNSKVGAFWFYDDIVFTCGETEIISPVLSSLSLTLRDNNNNLLKNYAFSLYLQKKDIDGNILKAKDYLVANLKTNDYGQATIYVTGGDPTQYQDTARYILTVKYKNLVFDFPDINIAAEADTKVNFSLSGLNLNVIDAAGRNLPQKTHIYVYEQKTGVDNKKMAGKKISQLMLDEYGQAEAVLPAGTYLLSIEDQARSAMKFYDVKVENGSTKRQTITFPVLRVHAFSGAGGNSGKYIFTVYSLSRNSDGRYKKNKIVYRKLNVISQYEDVLLASGKYLTTVKQGKSEYGAAISLVSGLKNVYLSTKAENLVNKDSLYRLAAAGSGAVAGARIIRPAADLSERLKGYILLQPESNGEVWYVNKDKKRYYLRDGASALALFGRLGTGITNSNLRLIPVGVFTDGDENDCDMDGLPDLLEEAIGTGVCDEDSDMDGFSDGVEALNNYDPLGEGELAISEELAASLSGSMLLQTESNGEIWYVNPRDKKRYYIPDEQAAFKIMKYLSLGITDADIKSISLAE